MLHQPEQPVLEPATISAGDLVVVYEGYNAMKAARVEPTGKFGTKFGHFPMKDWVGRRYGCKVTAKLGNNTAWLLLLRPTPELWTQVLKHRTQIMYVADISLVCMHLELRPGCTVLESGTGSGSLTHSLTRAVAPMGHVHSFEFHEERAKVAAKEFDSNGLGDLVTVQQRNIEELGFPEELHEQADALFLDLPRPWLAVPSAAQCLRPDGAFCSFSPCIEQVQKTCAKLEEEGFFCVRTIECLLRGYEVKQERLRTDLELREAAPRGQGQKGQKRKRAEQQTPVKQQKPGTEATPGPATESAAPGPAAGSDSTPVKVEAPTEGVTAASVPVPALNGPLSAAGDELKQPDPSTNGAAAAPLAAGAASAVPEPKSAEAAAPQQICMAKPVLSARGHTGYLTFARRRVE